MVLFLIKYRHEMFHSLFHTPSPSFNFSYEINDLWESHNVEWCALSELCSSNMHHLYLCTSSTLVYVLQLLCQQAHFGLPFGLPIKITVLSTDKWSTLTVINISYKYTYM